MRTIAKCLLFILVAWTPSFGQQPAYYENLAQYKEATELLGKEKYGAAQEKFEKFLKAAEQSAIHTYPNSVLADARYSRGYCAFNLLRNNTQALLEEFVSRHPANAHVPEAWFYIGKLHFLKQDYAAAMAALENMDLQAVESDMSMEARYMLGFSHFKEGNLDRAMTFLSRVKRTDREYSQLASWYYALINYEKGNYETALKGFANVPDNARYAKDLPVLEANCLLKLGRYDELEAKGSNALEDPRATGGELLVYGNAAYEQKDYAEALKYFEKYEEKRGRLDRDGRYRAAFSYYQQKDYQNAQTRFEQVLSPEDEIAQNAYYYLGHCYVKSGDKLKARTAFGEAADMDHNAEIQEEAMFQYAKSSYEARFLEDALAAFQQFTTDFPNSTYYDEAQGMIGEILLYTSNYKDAIDYFESSNGLNSIRAQKAYQRACYFYGLDLYRKEVYDKANSYFRKAYNQRHDQDITLSSYFWNAEGLFKAGKYASAIEMYNSYLRQSGVSKHAYHSKAWYGIAWSHMKLKHYDQAGKNFEKFIALAEKSIEPELYTDATLRAGDCEFVAKRYPNAINYYMQVRDFNYKFVDYALYQLGLTYFRVRDFQSSVSSYVNLINGYKKSEFRDDALLNASEVYLTWIKDYGKAARFARTLIREHPNSPLVGGAYLRIGIAEYQSNNERAAVDNFKKVVYEHCEDRESSIAALQNLSAMVNGSEYDRIMDAYKQKCPSVAMEGGEKENLMELELNVIRERFFEDNFAVTISKSTAFLSDYPGYHSAEVHYLRGQSYENTGNKDKALEDYQQVYNSGQASEYLSRALLNAAEIYFERENYLSSIELFAALGEKSDRLEDRMASLIGKAKNYKAMGDFARAKDEFTAIFTNENTTEFSKTKAELEIANCLYQLDQKGEALEIYTRIEKDYTNAFGAESQLMVAQIQYDQGDFDKSKQSVFDLKDRYPSQNYFKAKGFLVLAEDYLALGDTLMATKGTLKSLARQDRFPEIQQRAQQRMDEILSIWNGWSPDEGNKEEEGQ